MLPQHHRSIPGALGESKMALLLGLLSLYHSLEQEWQNLIHPTMYVLVTDQEILTHS